MSQQAVARTAAVLLAAGSGSRLGASVNKVLLPLDGIPILARSVRTVLGVEGVRRVVLVVRPEERDAVSEAIAAYLGADDLWMVDGGAQRHDSEWGALQALAPDIEVGDIEVVAIHDGARPLASPALWRAVIDAAAWHGGAIPVVRSPQLSHRDGALAPPGLAGMQTPQAFRAADLLAAHQRAADDAFTGTDTAACLMRYSDLEVVGVESTIGNLKLTFPEDIALAEALLSRLPR